MDSLDRAAGDAASATTDPAGPPPATRDGRPWHDTRFGQLIDAFQTILTAVILAFVFRSFFIEAFIIPSGSMANGLLGAHRTLLCPACGWEFDRGIQGLSDPTATAACPNCHWRLTAEQAESASKDGDRILVHKWVAAFAGWLGPRRWDVIVFRDPASPDENYIKRVAGLPGERIEILDGDVFVNGVVAHKPEFVQRGLWNVVHDQDHLGVDAATGEIDPPWRTASGDGWRGMNRRELIFQPRAAGDSASLQFAPAHSSRYLHDVSGYNGPAADSPVNDVRISAELRLAATCEFQWEIRRDADRMRFRLCGDGRLRITLDRGDGARTLVERSMTGAPSADGPLQAHVAFACVDWQIRCDVDGEAVFRSSAAEFAPDLERLRSRTRVDPPALRMQASGGLVEVRGLRVDRDVYYTYSPSASQRAGPGSEFALADGSYFVLGDNSAHSHDSREWYRVGAHLAASHAAGDYQLGTVRVDQIVGRAFVVYLPGLLPPDGQARWRLPDLGRVRLIR